MGHDANPAAPRGAGGRAAALLRAGAVRTGRDRDRRRSPNRRADRAIEPAKDRIWRHGARTVGDYDADHPAGWRSEEHTSELQSLMRISYAVFCLKKKKKSQRKHTNTYNRTATEYENHS